MTDEATTPTGSGGWLTTGEAAHRLGVRPQTLYAYVSRGRLRSTRLPGRRGSAFDADEVDRLAERGRAAPPSAGAVETVRSRVTSFEGDDLLYRGRRAVDLARTSGFEAVARLLWDAPPDATPFPVDGPQADRARRALLVLPTGARLADRLRVAVAVVGASSTPADTDADAVRADAARLLGTVAAALAPGPSAGPPLPLAVRLAPLLPAGPEEPSVAPLDPVLVLLADHGLAVSTVAARVAASSRAPVTSVVCAALGAADGHLHGSASTLAYRFLAEALSAPPVSVVTALAERRRAGTSPPGFGHRVYSRQDPRAEAVLAALPDHPVVGVVEQLRDLVDDVPTVDLALAAFAHAHGLRPDSGEFLFEFARVAGWVAHALEEYAAPALRFRVRGVYGA